MRGEEKKERISRSEAKGVLILILLLFCYQILVFVLNKFKSENVSTFSDTSLVINETPLKNILEKHNKSVLFEFDPNIISADSLQLLGFSKKQSEVILRYRDKGGVFRKASDFAKMYVVDSLKYEQLKVYIKINSFKEKRESAYHKRIDYRARLQNKENSMRPLKSEIKVNKRDKIEINAADSAAFTSLYGIGPYYAKKLIRYRERLGGYYNISQLLEIKGIDSLRFSEFCNMIYVDTSLIQKIDLSVVEKRVLENHPYIGYKLSEAIVKFRMENGNHLVTLDHLIVANILDAKVVKLISPYIDKSVKE